MGAVFALYSAWYFWIPKILGMDYSRLWGKVHFWILFIGVNVTFFPQHFLGLQGMPRRISDYPDAFAGWNLISSFGSIVSVVATFLFLHILYVQLVEGNATSRYPWLTPQFYSDSLQTILNRSYNSLEWCLTSPPKPHAFVSLPLQSYFDIRKFIYIYISSFTYYKLIALVIVVPTIFFCRYHLSYLLGIDISVFGDLMLLSSIMSLIGSIFSSISIYISGDSIKIPMGTNTECEPPKPSKHREGIKGVGVYAMENKSKTESELNSPLGSVTESLTENQFHVKKAQAERLRSDYAKKLAVMENLAVTNPELSFIESMKKMQTEAMACVAANQELIKLHNKLPLEVQQRNPLNESEQSIPKFKQVFGSLVSQVENKARDAEKLLEDTRNNYMSTYNLGDGRSMDSLIRYNYLDIPARDKQSMDETLTALKKDAEKMRSIANHIKDKAEMIQKMEAKSAASSSSASSSKK